MKDYFSLYKSQKTVEYFGLILIVPDMRGYLATDADGTIVLWSHEPTYARMTSGISTLVDITTVVIFKLLKFAK